MDIDMPLQANQSKLSSALEAEGTFLRLYVQYCLDPFECDRASDVSSDNDISVAMLSRILRTYIFVPSQDVVT